MSYIAQTSPSLIKLMNELYDGLEGLPRIKKACTDAFKALDRNLSRDNIIPLITLEELLQTCFTIKNLEEG
jgi:hypothetical protein